MLKINGPNKIEHIGKPHKRIGDTYPCDICEEKQTFMIRIGLSFQNISVRPNSPALYSYILLCTKPECLEYLKLLLC